ncbi:MAG: TAXI family TRAP transporter solute-binding subunit [Candidatus Tectomicrobia bacterium]|uniref:TAXI family TRAP transporter solute-binding subunit n=1 Tax=Tectimicrobiota bacterium TaxID=2528274 RepID=A0A932MPA9_UNCTE|nr:TAXI family TRAP transporter solute-binding subunit [Candidatus Tectomicrobia bacterium]
MRMRSLVIFAGSVMFAAGLGAGKASAAEKKIITMGSASVGGSLQLASSAWAAFIMKHNPDLNVNVEATGGNLDNYRLVDSGAADIGFSVTTTLYEGKKGLAWAKGKKMTNTNTCIPWYVGLSDIWSLGGKKITKLSDLNGKVITPGPAAGPANFILRLIVAEFGLRPKRIVNVSWGDALGQMADGLIDVGLISTISPFGALRNQELTHKVNYFYLDRADLERLVKKNPQYSIGTVKKGAYKYLDKDGESLAWLASLICNPKLDADVAYRLVKTTFDKKDELAKTMGEFGRQLSLENVKFANIVPFHPGAARYFKEQNVPLPKPID